MTSQIRLALVTVLLAIAILVGAFLGCSSEPSHRVASVSPPGSQTRNAPADLLNHPSHRPSNPPRNWSPIGLPQATVEGDGSLLREFYDGVPQPGQVGLSGMMQFRVDLNGQPDSVPDPSTGFLRFPGRSATGAARPPPPGPPPPPSTPPGPGAPPHATGARFGAPEVVLRPGEELWVIERRTSRIPDEHDDSLGCGSLIARRMPDDPGPPDVRDHTSRAYAAEVLDQARREAGRVGPMDARLHAPSTHFVPLPLAHTDVSARIDAYISSVRVTQQFQNPFADTIEAVYVFPLPEDAAVSDFVMTIGDRRIRGVVREREEARQVYEHARRQGHVATLLTQERPNIFTQHVANIEPGKRIDVDITYFNTLAYLDGYYEFVFPMVVGPRFNPSCSQGRPFDDGVGAVARGSTFASGQATEVEYLRPHERSGHDISLRVGINAGVAIESLECRSHQVRVDAAPESPERAEVVLSTLDSIPNKDFVLRYRVAGSDTKSAMLTQVDARGGFFTLMLVPPADLRYVDRGPVEMVFVVDCSGSMEGEPLAQARRAVEHALRALEPADTFQVINFAESASQLGSRPLAAEWDNVRRGIDYVRSLTAGGGTHMLNGLRAALDFPHDERRLRFVCFLTDGYIGNEAEILGTLKDRLGESRVFSMGMGSSPNRFLLEEMARVGRGAAAHVGLGDDAAQVMGLFMDRVSHPALTRLEIDWGGLDVSDVQPARLPDVFVGRPVLITGRFRGSGDTTVKVTGRMGRHGERIPILVPVAAGGADGDTGGRGSLAAVWARQRIAQLSRRTLGRYGDDEKTIAASITRTALDFGLMSAYTSFVAVDSLTTTRGPLGSTVEVAVPVPEGVNYDTTVQERRPAHARRPGDDR